jgi:hypothetical protein
VYQVKKIIAYVDFVGKQTNYFDRRSWQINERASATMESVTTYPELGAPPPPPPDEPPELEEDEELELEPLEDEDELLDEEDDEELELPDELEELLELEDEPES